MTTQRILLLSYLVLGLLVAMVLTHLVSATLGNVTALHLHDSVFGQDDFGSYLAGFVLGGGVGLWCWFDPRVKTPATQVVEELQRVTWPTVHDTRAAAFAVIIASLICAALLGLFDYGWGAVTARIYATP